MFCALVGCSGTRRGEGGKGKGGVDLGKGGLVLSGVVRSVPWSIPWVSNERQAGQSLVSLVTTPPCERWYIPTRRRIMVLGFSRVGMRREAGHNPSDLNSDKVAKYWPGSRVTERRAKEYVRWDPAPEVRKRPPFPLIPERCGSTITVSGGLPPCPRNRTGRNTEIY